MSKILISLLILNFVFSAGPREDRQVYTINNKASFSNIIGWCSYDGKWKSKKMEIDCYPNKIMEPIKSFEIAERPELIILKIHSNNYIVEKEELKMKFQFKKNQFDYIELKTLDDFYAYSTNSTTMIESDVAKFLSNEKYKEEKNSFAHNSDQIGIIYYHYDDVIQYFFTNRYQIGSTITIIGDAYFLGKNKIDPSNINDISKALENEYFESPLKEFESFFIKSASQ